MWILIEMEIPENPKQYMSFTYHQPSLPICSPLYLFADLFAADNTRLLHTIIPLYLFAADFLVHTYSTHYIQIHMYVYMYPHVYAYIHMRSGSVRGRQHMGVRGWGPTKKTYNQASPTMRLCSRCCPSLSCGPLRRSSQIRIQKALVVFISMIR